MAESARTDFTLVRQSTINSTKVRNQKNALSFRSSTNHDSPQGYDHILFVTRHIEKLCIFKALRFFLSFFLQCSIILNWLESLSDVLKPAGFETSIKILRGDEMAERLRFVDITSSTFDKYKVRHLLTLIWDQYRVFGFPIFTTLTILWGLCANFSSCDMIAELQWAPVEKMMLL